MKIIEKFEVPYYQFLTENKELSKDAPALAKDPEKLREFYKLMVIVRTMDAKAIALQRTGKLGTYPSTRGQEAVFVGVGKAMEKKRFTHSLLSRHGNFSATWCEVVANTVVLGRR